MVVGDLMLDKYIWGSADRISPEAPVPVVVVDSTSSGVGGAANVANNIKAMSGNVFLIGVIGENAEGDELKSLLGQKGIDCEGIVVDPARPTTSKTRIIAHKQQVVRLDWERVDEIDDRIAEALLSRYEKLVPGADAVVISDYDKGVVTPYLVPKFIQLAKANDKMVIVDPKPSNLHLFKDSTLLTPNKNEAVLALGLSGSPEINQIGKKMIDQLNLDAVLITLGEKGMYLKTSDGEEMLLPAHATDVFDVTGAGDTVVSTLSLALSSSSTYEEAAILANYAAGIAVTKLGAVAVSRDELLALFL